MTPKIIVISLKPNEISLHMVFTSGLKILSWVTLTCQFKSGPGHHSPLESSVCAGYMLVPTKTQNVSKRAEKRVSRHTMTHDFRSSIQNQITSTSRRGPANQLGGTACALPMTTGLSSLSK